MSSDRSPSPSEAKFGLIGTNSPARPRAYLPDYVKRPTMERVGVLVLTAFLILAAVGAGPAAVGATSNDTPGQGSDIGGGQSGLLQAGDTTNGTNTTAENEAETPTENETATTTDDGTTGSTDSEASVAPGAKLAGVIGSQRAEHESAVQTRAFDRAFERAATNESQASVVANSSERIEEQIQVLENESNRLQKRYQNDSLPESTFHARMTVVTARITALETRANRTSTRAKTIPESALEAQGTNTSDLHHLETRAQNVTNPRASAIAKQVAGPKVGQPTGPPQSVPGHAGDRGPTGRSNESENPKNATQNGSSAQSDRTRGSGNSTANNASAGQEPENTPGNGASAGQGPENTPGNDASAGENANDAQRGHAEHPTEGRSDGAPADNGQDASPFDDSDTAQHTKGHGGPGAEKTVSGQHSSGNSSDTS